LLVEELILTLVFELMVVEFEFDVDFVVAFGVAEYNVDAEAVGEMVGVEVAVGEGVV
jgi:hypothetical protein